MNIIGKFLSVLQTSRRLERNFCFSGLMTLGQGYQLQLKVLFVFSVRKGDWMPALRSHFSYLV